MSEKFLSGAKKPQTNKIYCLRHIRIEIICILLLGIILPSVIHVHISVKPYLGHEILQQIKIVILQYTGKPLF